MAQYKKGKIVKGSITGIEKYGIFVNLDNYYNGLIHISEMSVDFVKDVSSYGKIGETIYVKILDVDESANHVKLSIKDIDYRIEKDYNKVYIKSTGSGFEVLECKLNDWIEEKFEEMQLKSTKSIDN